MAGAPSGKRTLMGRGRRHLAAVLLAILVLPVLGMLAAPYETQSVMERRDLALPPSVPADARGWVLLPRRLDAWFADHFAWRGLLVRAAFTLQAGAGLRSSGSLQVVRGRGDWLLLRQGLLEASGGQTDPASARRYAAFVCGVQQEAKARGARFLFAPAPSTLEVYPEAAPDWLTLRRPTQPERILEDAGACGARTLDLRPAMLGAKGLEKLYQHHDSHWTNAGALVAFNAVAAALGEPWGIDPKSLGWRPGKPYDSDLVRLSGAFDLPQELAPEPPEGPSVAPVNGPWPDLARPPYPPAFVQAAPRAHPMVLVIGDSYTADFWPQYFRRAGVGLAWIHQAECRFDRRIYDRVKPDIVILAPASRLEFCH
ncbi:MAG: alginate O-acetyltransferase AlgX-related protein [Caulobacteraceae bacterium]